MALQSSTHRLENVEILKSINAPTSNNRRMGDYKTEIYFIG